VNTKGFTLLELLLSMTLLSLILVALTGGLRFLGRGAERAEAVIDEAERLDLARDLLSRQAGALFPLMGGDKLLFTGRPDRLAFPILRPPGHGPAGLMLAVFAVENEGGRSRLIYREYPFRPGANVMVAEEPTRSTELANSASPFSFHYRGKGDWQEQWADPAALPRLIALRGGGWPQLLARPRAERGPS
jgi:general secretion pathway protein J